MNIYVSVDRDIDINSDVKVIIGDNCRVDTRDLPNNLVSTGEVSLGRRSIDNLTRQMV